MKSILLVGLLSARNFGDGVIHRSSRFLFKQAMSSYDVNNEFEIDELDLHGLLNLRRNRPWILRKSLGLIRVLRYLLWGREVSDFRDFRAHYSTKIRCHRLIILAGGGIVKYKYEKFWLHLSALISAAERYRVPVVLNAVGVEGFDSHDRRCRMLRDSLNSPVVRMITTRDDIDTLRDLYLTDGNGALTELVADPAVWASEAYGVKKDESSDVVGIGLIRGGIFKDNEIAFEPYEVANFYAEIIGQLSALNIRWRLFTNGAPADMELVRDILARLGMNPSAQLVLAPDSDFDLVKTIAGFKSVVAARLHANIIAYSLNIPSVGLVWNSKLTAFGKNIGYPDRFLYPPTSDATAIVSSLLNAMKEGYDDTQRTRYRQSIQDSAYRVLRMASRGGEL